MSTFSFMVFALVLWMRSRFNTDADMTTILIPTFVQGVAMAFFFIPLVSLTLSGLPQSKIPSASGLSNFARITAGAFGTSISTTLWENRAAMHHAHLTEKMNLASLPATQTLSDLQSAGMNHEQALAVINRAIDQQAYMMSANDIFFASSMVFLGLLGVVWLARPVRSGPAVDASAAH
jgi:DHA2 family multidrug resistance protein